MKQLLEEIAGAVAGIYRDAVDPIGERFTFKRRATEGEIKGPPLVLILGNHSSGKSTFVNFLLDDDVQKTGLAPTDDGFTILSFGEKEEVRDGNAIVGNPELAYGGLRGFGDELVTHLRMKLRNHELLRQVTLVDSPGMIDALGDDGGRGFDFPGTVRWFAERADVVLVFFDPDKPGTTGETLQVFTQSLSGIDHKLLIVMNKMDQFRSLQDFARAYGALCWNLGKVIPRKDLPLIYTTFVPVPGAPEPLLPVGDFEKARHELVAEIQKAPARRVDNMLTQVSDFSEKLRLHARVLDQAARDLRRFRAKAWTGVVASVLLLAAAGAIAIAAGASVWYAVFLFVAAVAAGYAGFIVQRALVRREEVHLQNGLDEVFERLYARELLVRERTEDLRSLWRRVHDRTRETSIKLGLLSFPRLRKDELARIDQALEREIPELRSKLHKKTASAREPAVQTA